MVTKVGKRFRATLERYTRTQAYGPREAVDLVKDNATAKFDETVELHIRTGLDPRHADQQVRGSTLLPHGLGKAVRVAVFAEGDGARAAQAAGADIVGGDDLIARVEGGFTDFDVALAQRDLMGKVGKLGRILGPRGLMPNPRAGTVVDTADLARGIDEAKRGRVEFRVDRLANMHVPVGKASFDPQRLLDNVATVLQDINRAKPSGGKGVYLRAAYLTSTMGPSVKLDLQQALDLRAE